MVGAIRPWVTTPQLGRIRAKYRFSEAKPRSGRFCALGIEGLVGRLTGCLPNQIKVAYRRWIAGPFGKR